jgi:hypothetical protein
MGWVWQEPLLGDLSQRLNFQIETLPDSARIFLVRKYEKR